MRVESSNICRKNGNTLRFVAAGITALALALASVVPVQAGGLGWPQFRYGPTHNGFTMATSINPANVKTMRQRWTHGLGVQQSDPDRR